jgi:nucleotide-binding universal stress UspA family protein
VPGCVVVGVRDGRSAAAVAFAADLAHDRGLWVLAVHATPPPPPVPELIEWAHDPSWLTPIVREEWCQALRVRGVRHEVLVVMSPPGMALLATAEHEHADVIVVGQSRVRPRWRGRTLAAHLADNAAQPVVVVPPLATREARVLRRAARGTRSTRV